MSEDLHKQINELIEQNKNLQVELAQSKAGIDGLLSQLDAHREQINEVTTGSLNLRANMLHLKKHNNRLLNQIAELQKHVDSLNKQLADANRKVQELEDKAIAA